MKQGALEKLPFEYLSLILILGGILLCFYLAILFLALRNCFMKRIQKKLEKL